MLVLVIGGSGSGKSEYAEQLAVKINCGELIYLATMEPFDAEGVKRVERHRKLRRDKNFTTHECYTHLERMKARKGQTILLECVSNLVANEMFSATGRKERTGESILMEIGGLCDQVEHMVIVTNNVFEDGILYEETTRAYLKTLAQVNEELAQRADCVVEVVHGIPLPVKGGLLS